MTDATHFDLGQPAPIRLSTTTRAMQWTFRCCFPALLLSLIADPTPLSLFDKVALAVGPLGWLYLERMAARVYERQQAEESDAA
jgi:hypothetical protein